MAQIQFINFSDLSLSDKDLNIIADYFTVNGKYPAKYGYIFNTNTKGLYCAQAIVYCSGFNIRQELMRFKIKGSEYSDTFGCYTRIDMISENSAPIWIDIDWAKNNGIIK